MTVQINTQQQSIQSLRKFFYPFFPPNIPGQDVESPTAPIHLLKHPVPSWIRFQSPVRSHLFETECISLETANCVSISQNGPDGPPCQGAFCGPQPLKPGPWGAVQVSLTNKSLLSHPKFANK